MAKVKVFISPYPSTIEKDVNEFLKNKKFISSNTVISPPKDIVTTVYYSEYGTFSDLDG